MRLYLRRGVQTCCRLTLVLIWLRFKHSVVGLVKSCLSLFTIVLQSIGGHGGGPYAVGRY